MRTLIVGPGIPANLARGFSLLSHEKPGTWEVVSSYKQSCDKWVTSHAVDRVTSFHDLKDYEPDESMGLVIEVVAQSFYEKPWVKAQIKSAKDLLILCASPVTFLDKETLASFQKVYATKTVVSDKQTQYYSVFVNADTMSFGDFKKMLRTLEVDQCVEISEGGKKVQVVTIPTAAPLEHVERKQRPEREKQERANVEKKVAAVIDMPTGAGEHRDKPDKVELTDACSELWISLKPAADVTLADAVASLESMMRNDLIVSMFALTVYKTHPEDGTISVYVQVFLQRQDLFVALILNMLQSLRSSGVIDRGSIVV